MADNLICQGCSSSLVLPPEAIPGRTVRCPKCGLTMPVPEPAKEEFLECDLLERMKGFEGYRVRGDKKPPPEPVVVREAPPAKKKEELPMPPRALGRFLLLLILLLLVGGLALAGTMASALLKHHSPSTTGSASEP
jgi:hypothetical protein